MINATSSITTQVINTGAITTQTINSGAIISGSISTQNNNINAGTGTITVGAITTQNYNINAGTGALIVGSITSQSINTGGYAINAGAITSGSIYTQNNSINTGNGNLTTNSIFSGIINTGSSAIYSGSLISRDINTQNFNINTGSGTITVGSITSGSINTQCSTITAGAITTGTINTQNNNINTGTGSLIVGTITSGTISTLNNNINLGSGSISGSNFNIIPGGSFTINHQSFIDSNINITTANITTQNNNINVGTGIIYTNSINAGPSNFPNIDFNGANLLHISIFGVGSLQTPSIQSLTNYVSFNNSRILNVDSLVVNSNITVLANGLNTYVGLPCNVVVLNPGTGQILDNIISSNIVRLMSNGTINPAQLPIVPSNRSTLLRTNDNVGIGTRQPQQKLHVNGGNECITQGRLGIGTITPLTSLHIYDDNASVGAVINVQARGSTDYLNIADINNNSIFKVGASCNIGICNGSPLYTLDVNGTINTNNLRTNTITCSSGSTVDFTNTSITNIYNASICNLTVTSNFNIPTSITVTNIKSTDTTYTNVLASASNTNIVVNTALHIIGYDMTLWPGSGQIVGNIDSTTQTYIGLKVDYTVYAKNLITPSDYRIKSNITPISTENCLNILQKLPIYDYTLIAEDDKPTQGFIAQEIEKIIPHSVATIRNAIPSIMRYVKREPDTFSSIIINNDKYNIQKGDIIKAFIDNKSYDLEVSSSYLNKITFKYMLPEQGQIYLYGVYVDDFKAIEHQTFLPVICGAVQEMNKIITDQQKTIDSIINRLSLLEKMKL